MPLPILTSHAASGPEALLRFFHQTEHRWTEHLAEEAALSAGSAFANAEFDHLSDANRVLGAALADGQSAQEATAEIDQHFAEAGTRCQAWVMNPSAAESQTAPLVQHLETSGFHRTSTDIFYLSRVSSAAVLQPLPAGLKIIPARASFRHSRQLADAAAAEFNEPQLAEAIMWHLEDPHLDAWIAILNGDAVATVGVLAIGEIGRIDNLYVAAAYRRTGIGAAMMARALEICARSLFKHIFTSCNPENTPAAALFGRFRFQLINQFIQYRA